MSNQFWFEGIEHELEGTLLPDFRNGINTFRLSEVKVYKGYLIGQH